jgi:metal-responsive CopG/Arc/MetJ family transcriptional regulator
MKTAISVPDEVFEQAEYTAKRLKLSRSELYSRALSEYLARHTDSEVTAAINAAISDAGQPTDPTLSAHNRRRAAAWYQRWQPWRSP